MSNLEQKKISWARGFTLVEVTAVIVVLAIVAMLGSKFISQSANAYKATEARAKLINAGRQSVESMTRQLRVSLSYSVRITNSNTCLEFLPIVGGGYYLDPVPDSMNGGAASASIAVSPHVVDYGQAKYVSIGAAASTEVYGAAPVSRAALNSRSATSLTLSAPKSWQRNSLGQHFFLLDEPQAFCVVSGQLRLYTGQDITAAGVNLASLTRSILANNVTSPTPFSLSNGSENRNVIAMFNFTFASSISGESISLNQSVMIRNVP